MKLTANIVGILLGLLFVAFGFIYFFKLVPMPLPPTGSPPALYMEAMQPTGYLNFVKIMEIIGGLLVAIPRTRNLGLLILGPIIVNIFAFHIFITKGAGLIELPLIIITLLTAFLLWCERKAFLRLIA